MNAYGKLVVSAHFIVHLHNPLSYNCMYKLDILTEQYAVSPLWYLCGDLAVCW